MLRKKMTSSSKVLLDDCNILQRYQIARTIIQSIFVGL